jgi:alanine racemase
MVRLGIGMYGYSANENIKSQLTPAIAWKSVITQIKTIEKGESVGYSRTFIAERPTRIAVVPIGYADGFRKSLGNGIGGMYVRGHFCKVLGNVCMDMTMIDVTDVPAKDGDIVEIIGENQKLDALAKLMGTIPYEVLTSVSQRVHRIYIEN